MVQGSFVGAVSQDGSGKKVIASVESEGDVLVGRYQKKHESFPGLESGSDIC